MNSKRNKVVFETLAISSDFDRLLPQETAISWLPVEVKLLGNCSPCKIEIFIYHSMITFWQINSMQISFSVQQDSFVIDVMVEYYRCYNKALDNDNA